MPDLITTAKGIAGGLPLAGVTGRAEIMDAVHAGGLGGTYGGNPVACAAALAAIDDDARATTSPGGPASIECGHARRGCTSCSRAHPASATSAAGARCWRSSSSQPGHADPDAGRRRPDRSGLPPAQGVVTLTCGTYGNVLRFLPPLVIRDELLEEGLDVVVRGASPSHRASPRARWRPCCQVAGARCRSSRRAR